MPWFWLPLTIGIGCVLCGILNFKYDKHVIVLGILVAITAIPVMLCIDSPSRERRNAIAPGTCIECKLRTEDSYYAIGCDGREYKLNMSAWALLDARTCD